MKQGNKKQRPRIDGPLSESDHDEIVIRSNRRGRATRFLREARSNTSPSTSAQDAVPSSSSGIIKNSPVFTIFWVLRFSINSKATFNPA